MHDGFMQLNNELGWRSDTVFKGHPPLTEAGLHGGDQLRNDKSP
jgi:hypothetical protein